MDLKASDDSELGSNKVKIPVYEKVGRHGVRHNGRHRYYLLTPRKSGAERIPQKSIIKSNYRKQMIRYWVDLCPQRRERAQHITKYVKSPDPE